MTALVDLDVAIDKALACESCLDVAEMARLAHRMEFLKLRAFRDYERSEVWRDEGFMTAAAAVRKQCHLTEGAARHALDLARKLEALPVLAEAFAAGEVSRGGCTRDGALCAPMCCEPPPRRL